MDASCPVRLAVMGSTSERIIQTCTMAPVFALVLLEPSPVAMATMGEPSSMDGPAYRIAEAGVFVVMGPVPHVGGAIPAPFMPL